MLTAAVWRSPTSVSCVAPALTSGNTAAATTIQYVPNGIDVAIGSVTYSYDEEVSLESLWPPSGGSEGGMLVRIQGQKFRTSTNIFCRFGNAIVKGTYVSRKIMQCLSPALREAGNVLWKPGGAFRVPRTRYLCRNFVGTSSELRQNCVITLSAHRLHAILYTIL